ncbi:MAG TPA: response regulator transcription factor [Gaiellaceae bacterium]|jgi:DNA-binding NarL/FixJ family response regulator
MSAPLTVLLADDHPLFRHGLRAALDATPSVDVVGEVSDGAEAVRLALELEPDVVLMEQAEVASLRPVVRGDRCLVPRLQLGA